MSIFIAIETCSLKFFSGFVSFLFFVSVVLFSFCGHSVDALALRADEGRGGLRYALGS